MEKPSDQTILKVVTQRVTSGGLLIDAGKEEWIGFGRGLIFHVSFTKHCPIDKDFTSVCKSLLNSNLSTSGQWQQDHGDADSVLGLCKKGLHQSIILIPQASLVTKLVPGDKYLKYHSQSQKEVAEVLFRCFEHCLRKVCAEALAKNVTPNENIKRPKNNPEKLRNADVLPILAFKEGLAGEEFSEFDDTTGFPTLDKDGNEITKSKRKKLEKMFLRYEEKWKKKTLLKSNSCDSKNEAVEKTNDERELDLERMSLKDSNDTGSINDSSVDELTGRKLIDFSSLELGEEKFVFPDFVRGTFGGRQGLEFVSSGPFTHSFCFD